MIATTTPNIICHQFTAKERFIPKSNPVTEAEKSGIWSFCFLTKRTIEKSNVSAKTIENNIMKRARKPKIHVETITAGINDIKTSIIIFRVVLVVRKWGAASVLSFNSTPPSLNGFYNLFCCLECFN